MDNNFRCSSYLNRVRYDYFNHNLFVVLDNESELNSIDLNNMLNKYNSDNVTIMNITSIYNLNNALKTIKNINYNGNIIIDLCSPDPKSEYKLPPMILKLDNRDRIDLSNIPNNVKIHAFSKNNNQTEFTTWAHNLSEEGKKKLYNVLDKEDQELFIKQEKVIGEVVKDICDEYPTILNLSKKEQFDIVFNYINEKYLYAKECTNNGKSLNNDSSWAKDALETYKKGRGACLGRANLLTLATNNNYLRLNCSTVLGKYHNVLHAWNEFIDENNVYEYDMSFNIKNVTTLREMEEKGYIYDRVYPKVIGLKQKSNEIKNNSHFSHPLPKTKKNTLISGKNNH